MAVTVADAYSATGAEWQSGPGRVYDRLAEIVIDLSPIPLDGLDVLDVGAGTGAASRAALAAGARSVVAADVAWGMLAIDAMRRPPAIVADSQALPFRARSFDAVAAAFSFNHLEDPVVGFVESRRVLRLGGVVIASSYAADDTHPVKNVVEAVLADHGWSPPAWYDELRQRAMPQLATASRCMAAADAADLAATVHALRVPFDGLRADDLVAWRLGMAAASPFVTQCSADERRAIVDEAVARLGTEWPPLVRSVLVTTAVV